MKRQRPLKKPPEPPPGYIHFYWDLVPIAEVERWARESMAAFDRLPREKRDAINYQRTEA
jgi:hypothetical protein